MIRSLAPFALVLAACGDGQPGTPPVRSPDGSGSAVPPTDDVVLEVVYLHEIAAAHVQPDETICLRVRDTTGATADAPPALVAAVARRHPSAVAASACSGGGRDPVRHGERRAVMFDIGPVVRDTQLRVEGGGGHRGGGAIRELEYIVEHTGGALRVGSERVLREN